MRLAGSARRNRNAGVAAIEFALLMPVLVMLFLGVADFSMAYHDQLQMSSALSAGAEYAFTQGQTESGSTLDTDVQTFVNSIISTNLKNATATVTVYYNGASADGVSTNCYCVNGSPPTYTSQGTTCGSSCSDASGSTGGKYVSINGSLTYTPMFSINTVFFAGINPIKQTITVRLQ
jgi:Flp pilus assembly protein TadG